MIENIKIFIADILEFIRILKMVEKKTLSNNNAIRVINYHRTPIGEKSSFEKQISYFQKNYQNIDWETFKKFKNNEIKLEKQGLIITFDDGLKNNYTIAAEILEKYGFIGYFFVSTGLLNTGEYMSFDDVKNLIKRGHFIGCHTYTHHRMNENDSEELLDKEIIQAKKDLMAQTESEIDIFCWCGGEEATYTKKAHNIIKKHYDYAFMTNSNLVYQNSDNHFLQRTNIEARWSLSMVKFQLSGIMDVIYKNKRERVRKKLI